MKKFSLFKLNPFPNKAGLLDSGKLEALKSAASKGANLAKGAYKTAYEGGQKSTVDVASPGLSAVSKGVGFVWYPLKFIAMIAIILLLVAGLAFTGINLWQLGTAKSGATKISATAENVGGPLGSIAKQGFWAYLTGVSTGEMGTGMESEIETQATDPDLGVKISRIEQVGRPYYGEPIKIISTIRAKGPEDMKLAVYCKLSDQDPIPASVSSALEGNNPYEATIIRNSLDTLQATCTFPKGITPDKKTVLTPVGTSTLTKTLPIKSTEKVRLMVGFDFVTKAFYNAYIMPSEDLEALRRAQKDPFVEAKVNDPYLSSDGKIRSRATAGPVNLGIGAYVAQPFTENKPYTFALTISNNMDWSGNMKKLENLYVYVPQFMRLEGDSDFSEERGLVNTCAFDYTGQVDERGYRMYKLKESYFAQINQECDSLSLKNLALTEEQCIDLFGKNREIVFTCDFKVLASQGEGLRYDSIRADAKYIYQVESVSTVDAFKRPEPPAVA